MIRRQSFDCLNNNQGNFMVFVRLWRQCAFGLAALLLVCLAHADTPAAAARDLKIQAPEAVGFSSQRLQRLDESMQQLVDSKQLAGIVTLAARHGKIVYSKSFGAQDLASGKPMPKDAIFRIYSMTKPVTGVAMMILYEEGKWQPDDPIAKYLPEFADLKVFKSVRADGKPELEAPLHPPTMGELMTHTAGFTYGVFGNSWVDQQYAKGLVSPATFEFTARSLHDMAEGLAHIPLAYQPGTRWVYSVSADIQARIVEKLSGRPFAEFLRERIFEPLRMTDTAHYVPESKRARLATLYQLDPMQHALAVRAVAPDPAATPSLTLGGIGLYSTANDYLRFAQMLLNGGELDGVRILGPRTVELMCSNKLPDRLLTGEFGPPPSPLLPGRGFGYDVGVMTDPLRLGDPTGVGTYSWLGIAGTWFWVDPQQDVVFVGLTQRFADPTLPAVWNIARAAFYQALVDPRR
jgi:CubicO group peptidase (beta-lactamase class C family)